MNCDTALDRMLEAEPSELRGDTGSTLGRHLAGCPRCRRVAGVLATAMESLDTTLATYGEAGDADAAAEAALAAVRRAEPSPADPPSRRGRRTGGPAPTPLLLSPRAWVPLAAAALVAVVLLADGDGPAPPAGEAGSTGRPEALAPRLAVAPPPGRSAAVLETRNPDITIIWLYQREGP